MMFLVLVSRIADDYLLKLEIEIITAQHYTAGTTQLSCKKLSLSDLFCTELRVRLGELIVVSSR